MSILTVAAAAAAAVAAAAAAAAAARIAIRQCRHFSTFLCVDEVVPPVEAIEEEEHEGEGRPVKDKVNNYVAEGGEGGFKWFCSLFWMNE